MTPGLTVLDPHTGEHAVDPAAGAPSFLGGGGEMGALMRAHDWSHSSLGDPATWPQALRTCVRLMLNTGHPMYIFWGPDGACLYNDAYRESIGLERHPGSIGLPAFEVWEEIWPIIGPQVEQVMSGGGATWHVDQLVPITRHGRVEDVFWTYSFSPIDDETVAGGIGGVLVVCSETTQQVLTARQLASERDQLAKLFELTPTFMALLSGPEHLFQIANPGYMRLVDHRPVVGRTVAEALPESVPQGYLDLLDEVYRTGTPYIAEGALITLGEKGSNPSKRYLDFVYQPVRDSEGAVTGIFVEGVDVTARTLAARTLREKTEQLEQLDAIGEATRSATDARAIMDATTRLLGEHLQATRCAYADVEPDNDSFTILGEWTAPGYSSITGSYSLAAFGPRAVEALHRGDPLVICDVVDELTPGTGGAAFASIQVRSIVCCPLIKAAGLRGLMAVHMDTPHKWPPAEVALIQAVAERSWAHVERVRANDTLAASEARYREMAGQLSDSHRLKDEFLATLAHELRNPLAPIRNALELMQLAPNDPALRASARQVMGRQVTHIVRLIDDLLDLSRVNRGLIELRRTRLPLATVIQDAIETSRPLIVQSGHVLTVSLPDQDLLLDVDPTRMVQVFANLLNNASKFTPRAGRIALSARADGDQVVVSVRDSGVGIPVARLHDVFDMFTQVERSHAQIGGGLGIGLTLVRRLVEMHGGSVQARSEGPGTGSEFIVRLPRARSADPVPVQDSGPSSSPPQRRILVADDNIDGAETLAMMLNVLGHETRTVHDGEAGLLLAREFRPQVMVLDIAMPGLDGLDLARCIRAEAWGRDVILIAASGWGSPEHVKQSRDAGFDHHLVKPIDLKVLERLIE